MSNRDPVLIRAVESSEANVLAELALRTFWQSHGHSATEADINKYTSHAFSTVQISHELSGSENIFHFLTLKGRPIGYSKMNFNTNIEVRPASTLSKLERIYLLKEYHGMGKGRILMDHAIELSKQNAQEGMWLYTWIKNEQAVKFYQNYGFEIVGKYDFRISPEHVNPNHQMLLEW